MKKDKGQQTARAGDNINKVDGDLRRFASPGCASKVRREIIATIKGLNTFPGLHQGYDELTDKKYEYRRALTLDYKIVFTINEDVLEVVVVQIYHQNRGPEWIDENVKP